MKLHIKNMVCDRCIMAVNSIFKDAGFATNEVKLGSVEIKEVLSPSQRKLLSQKLNEYGFQLIDDHNGQTIEKIKNFLIHLVHYSNVDLNEKYSSLIESELGRDYTYLSNLFSMVEGITIEKFIINQKIERVKELLVYGELTLNEIAFEMGYSSVAYLSSQFKKVTGLTPTHFKKIGENKRKPLDSI